MGLDGVFGTTHIEEDLPLLCVCTPSAAGDGYDVILPNGSVGLCSDGTSKKKQHQRQ